MNPLVCNSAVLEDDFSAINCSDGKWVTVNGRHILIGDGQSVESALDHDDKSDLEDEHNKSTPSLVTLHNPGGRAHSFTVKHNGEHWQVHNSDGQALPKKFGSRESAKAWTKEKVGAEIDRRYHAEKDAGTLKWAPNKSRLESSEAMLCHVAFAAPTATSREVMYMPGGVQTITPSQGGRAVKVQVMVDRAGAQALESQRATLEAKGKKPYFDFNHEDGEASFWPTAFFWRDGAGIYARGEWSDVGEQAIVGKRYRQFSPVFYVDDVRKNPATIVCRDDAKPNMGGLVNDPAFHTILPFWAKDAGDNGDNNQPNQILSMTEQEIAELRAKTQELENERDALRAMAAVIKAKGENDAAVASELRIKEAEIKAGNSDLEIEMLRTKNDALVSLDTKRRQTDAIAAVEKATARGAIPAKDEVSQKRWVELICADPGKIVLLESVPGNTALLPSSMAALTSLSARASGINHQYTLTDPRVVLGTLSALSAKQMKLSTSEDKRKAARDFAAIYATEFRGDNAQRVLDAPLVATEAGDLNTLSGTLVTQRTLELLKFQFPDLKRFTTDFSEMPAQFNQTIVTRTITIPDVQTYNVTTGWTDSSKVTTDVPVTINKHIGVPITFNENTLASTARMLFNEFAPASSYALGKQMVDDLYANITDANFTNNTVIATASFARATVISIGTALTLRGVPQGADFRTMLLYPTVFSQLSQDSSLVNFAAFQKGGMFTEAVQSGVAFTFPVHGFSVYESANMPTNDGNVTGFAGSRSALIIATRVPNDYASIIPGSSFGNVSIVTDPDIGISVMLVQYVSHTLGRATQRVSLMYGTAAGQTSAGQLIKAHASTGSSRTS